MNLTAIKELVKEELRCNFWYNYVTKGINLQSPAIKISGYDDRDWYHCKLCEHKNLSRQGIVVHLAKKHSIKQKYSEDELIDIILDIVQKQVKKTSS